jgi:1-acyl-sn-glycerol-3-phosphate acyltransferase
MTYIYKLCRHIFWLLARLFFRHEVIHAERILTDGPVLVCANHTSYLDPPAVGIAFPVPIHYLARRSLYSNAFARWLFPRLNVVPVDQERPEVSALKTIVRLLQSGKHVLIFPEGERSVTGELLRAEPGTGFILAKARVPVQPVRVFGAHESLPRGVNRLRLRKLTIIIGEPLRFTDADFAGGKAAYQIVSDKVMSAIAALECPPDRIPAPRELDAQPTEPA